MKADIFPVERVSWDDAQEFVRQVNALPEKQRGGDWISIGRYCRAELRCRRTPDNRYGTLGFRLAAGSQNR